MARLPLAKPVLTVLSIANICAKSACTFSVAVAVKAMTFGRLVSPAIKSTDLK